MEHIFVYGTLMRGESHAFLLERIGGSWQQASVFGHLYPQGTGPISGYPVVVLDPAAGAIPGYVFSAENLAHHWAALDDYEGEGYRRVMTDALLPGGNTVSVHIYVLDEAC